MRWDCCFLRRRISNRVFAPTSTDLDPGCFDGGVHVVPRPLYCHIK